MGAYIFGYGLFFLNPLNSAVELNIQSYAEPCVGSKARGYKAL